jgi:rhodanese-related sulfurtransferase
MARDRAVKLALNEQFARIGKSLSAPRRLELLDLLAQGERGVEELATETQMSIGLTSAHLQALRRAGLVETRRDRTRIFYRLSGDDVYGLLASLRTVARVRFADVQFLARTHLGAGAELEAVSRDELLARVRAGAVTVIDVRPRQEYAAGHIPGALSIPVDELKARLAELPRATAIVAYCRGPYCLYAPTAVNALLKRGFQARRLEDGFPEWRLAGLPVATGFDQPQTK